MKPKIGLGVYTMDEAARLIDTPQHTLRGWFQGGKDRERFFEPDYEMVGARRPLSFRDLVEALILSRLRKRGFSQQYLRTVHHRLCERLENKHAFCHASLVTTGPEIFYREVQLDNDKARLFDLSYRGRNQMVEEGLLDPVIVGIDFGVDDFASRWIPTQGIVVDPDLNFGAPTIEGTGIAAHVLVDAWKAANKNIATVTDWYDVEQAKVEAAIKLFTPGRAA